MQIKNTILYFLEFARRPRKLFYYLIKYCKTKKLVLRVERTSLIKTKLSDSFRVFVCFLGMIKMGIKKK